MPKTPKKATATKKSDAKSKSAASEKRTPKAAPKPPAKADKPKPVKEKAKPVKEKAKPKQAKPVQKGPEKSVSPEKAASPTQAAASKKVVSKSGKASNAPPPDQSRRAAERLVGSLIRDLLGSRKRNYQEGITVEKKYYAKPLFEESRRTYTRYFDAEQKERILKMELVSPAAVHVYTSGEGMGKNRYLCAWENKEWRITAIDVMCGECSGVGGCRWCEGKGCLDCQQTGRCVPCSGTGWMKWAK